MQWINRIEYHCCRERHGKIHFGVLMYICPKICNKPLCSAHEYYCVLCDDRFYSDDILECYKCEPPLPVTRCKKCDPKFVHTRHS